MRLKTKLGYLIIAASLAACNGNKNQSGFELSGTLKNAGEGVPVYLDRLTTEGTKHIDSTKMDKEGKFAFHTQGIYKGFYNLRVTEASYATLILDSTENITITGNSQLLGDTYTVTGSNDSKLFSQMNSVMKTAAFRMDSIKKMYQALLSTYGNDTAKMDSLGKAFEKPYDNIMKGQQDYIAKFVKDNPTSFACLAAIQQLPYDDYNSSYITLDDALNKAYPTSSYVTMFHKDVTNLRRVSVGSPAPDFTLADTEGKDVSLSSFKGKVVLIDFWASWCAPCRASLPGIVRIYNKYKNKNFTILSVSLDKDKEHWVNAIKEFHLDWTNISDLKYWNSKVVRLYNFDGIPFNVLVGTDGNIIAKNLDEQGLNDKIESLVGKS